MPRQRDQFPWLRPLTVNCWSACMDPDTMPLPDLIKVATAMAVTEGRADIVDMCMRQAMRLEALERLWDAPAVFHPET